VHYALDYLTHDAKYFSVDNGSGEITLKKRASEMLKENNGRREFNFRVCDS